MTFSVNYCYNELLLRCCRHSGSTFDGSAWQKVIFIWWKQPFSLIYQPFTQAVLYGHNYKIEESSIFQQRRRTQGSFQYLSPIQDGHFRGCSRMEGGKKAPIPKTCHTYPTMMKLGTVIPYLKKIQKIYESRDTLSDFCWHQHFFTGNQQIL